MLITWWSKEPGIISNGDMTCSPGDFPSEHRCVTFHKVLTFHRPPNTWRNNNVIITSKRRHFDNNYVIIWSLRKDASSGCVRMCVLRARSHAPGKWRTIPSLLSRSTDQINIGDIYQWLLVSNTSLIFGMSWWRHRMETFCALLTLCAGNSPVTGEFPAQRPVTRSFEVFSDLCLNKRLRKQTIVRLVVWDAIVLIMTSL